MTALKQTCYPRGMANTVRMRTAVSLGQRQPESEICALKECRTLLFLVVAVVTSKTPYTHKGTTL